jgi:hypothetical protein
LADEKNERYDTRNIPALFADGAQSIANSREVVKVYFGRLDSDPTIVGPPTVVPFLQIVMPVSGFVDTALFFERRLKVMIDEGTISAESVDALRNSAVGENGKD